jgi:hypothetical protein
VDLFHPKHHCHAKHFHRVEKLAMAMVFVHNLPKTIGTANAVLDGPQQIVQRANQAMVVILVNHVPRPMMVPFAKAMEPVLDRVT